MISAIALSWFVGFALLWKTQKNLWKIHPVCGKLRAATAAHPHSFLTGQMTSNLLTSDF